MNYQKFPNFQNNNHRQNQKEISAVFPPGSVPTDTLHISQENKKSGKPKAYTTISDIDTYLEGYKNTYVSLTLSVCNLEVCGILKEIGHGFLVLEDPDTLNLTITKISNILMIKMFCNVKS